MTDRRTAHRVTYGGGAHLKYKERKNKDLREYIDEPTESPLTELKSTNTYKDTSTHIWKIKELSEDNNKDDHSRQKTTFKCVLKG